MGPQGITTPQRGEESTFTPAADPIVPHCEGSYAFHIPDLLTSSTLQTCPLGKWWCVMSTTVTRLAWVDQHRPRREADRIGHQNDELLRHEPAHVAHRQPEAVPEEPEEQRVDLLQVASEPNLSNACLNFHHFDSQSAGYLERVTDTATVYSRLFEFLTTLTFRALHGHLATLRDS